MGKPGAKKMDQIVSVTPGDVHIIMIPSPGGPVPTPIPHPCTSIIKDKVAEKVKVMGQPGAVKGSISQHTPPHIPMGPGPFQKPPANKGEIVTASSNVFYEGKEAAMLGDTGKMCADPSDAPVGKVIGTAATVLVGGGGSGSDEARAAAADAAMKAAAAACHKWINANMPPGADREQAHRDLCTATGHPIDVATGKMFTRNVDLKLPGRIPFEFVRNYSSARSDIGVFGRSWRHSYEIQLVVHRDFVAHRDPHGRFLPFEPVPVGEQSHNVLGRLTLTRAPEGYVIVTADGMTQFFPYVGEPRANAAVVPIGRIADRFGNRIRFDYTDGKLVRIGDSARRVILFDYNEQGFICALCFMPDQESETFETIRTYRYSDKDDLIDVRDEIGNPFRFEYSNHLLVRETDRNWFSFYFAYDEDGWCRKTWGDGCLLSRNIDYDHKNQSTRVCNSEGNVTLYLWNEHGLVEKEIDPLGNEWKFRYDEHQHKTRAEDPLGNAWLYVYDSAGNLLSRTDPNDNVVTIEYEESGRRTAYFDTQGRNWPLRYDTDGQLVSLLDPESHAVNIEWSGKGDLVASVDEVGRRTSYVYDEMGNMVERKNNRGLVAKRGYDFMGRLLHETDPLGPILKLEYDRLGRVKSELWRARGKISYEHDAEGNVRKVIDGFGVATFFEYGRFNQLLKRSGPDAAITLQEFDSENRLKAVIYPGGRRAEFGYDADGRISWKLSVDGRRLNYVRNSAGFVTEVHDAAGLIASYEHDGLGRITRRETADGEETTFVFDPSGQLVSAANENGEVMMEYDSCGRVVEEIGPYGAMTNEFDPAGRLTKSSFGEELTCTLSRQDGAVTFATGAGSARADYDSYGRLGCLDFSHGGVERYTYRTSGRPEVVVRNGEEIRYEYDAAGCVSAIGTSKGSKKWFERDAHRRLVASTRNGTEPVTTVRFHYDAQGNRSRDEEVFRFASGNRLEGTPEETLKYDLRGRLVGRYPRNGVSTEYHYSAEGLLKVVIHGSERTCFRYDALDRRISKTFNGKETRYAWEGSRLAHEWRPDGEERNYIYRPNSYVPLMCHRRVNGSEWEVLFFHNDHRGCPESLTNSAGQEVWCAEIGPFGEIEREEAQVDQPLALPGQYRDVETGLVYNYRRYFDPNLTIFITPDPLGHLAGDQLYAFAPDPITKVDPLGLSSADYDQTKATPHRIVEINGVKYVEFDARKAFTSGSNINVGGSGVGPDGSPDTMALIGPNGEVVVFEGRHRAVAAAAGDPIPEHIGGIPGEPGHLRYELGKGDTGDGTTGHVGPPLAKLASNPAKLDAARSGHPSKRTT